MYETIGLNDWKERKGGRLRVEEERVPTGRRKKWPVFFSQVRGRRLARVLSHKVCGQREEKKIYNMYIVTFMGRSPI